MNIPRPEYPRPQFVRENWWNLNGKWGFEIDFGMSGRDRKLFGDVILNDQINVPFCPESKLSGIDYDDFMNSVWYKRVIYADEEMLSDGKRTILHIGACDYETEVWINGNSVGKHIGGYVSFSFDITDFLKTGENYITICADDITRGNRPRGKQSHVFYSRGCDYTRTTGIWQTVWIETVPKNYISFTKYTTDIDNGLLYIDAEFKITTHETKLFKAEAFFNDEAVGCNQVLVKGTTARMVIKLDKIYLWHIGDPNLYDLKLTFTGADFTDTVGSYFGMREIVYADHITYLNKKPVFQRLILDQGFYPTGVYTAPTDEDLIGDIKRSMDMGFNGARLHQKVFEPRFLYHCDKMGYIVWGEHASWGVNLSDLAAYQAFMPEWLEILRRDFNHPAIVGWCPLNETNKEQNKYLLKYIYDFTKNFDNTRPVIDTSGYVHVATDILDCHNYDQNPESFKKFFDDAVRELTFNSEYGGIWWQPDNPDGGWGYGNRPSSEQEFIARYKALTDVMLDNPNLTAFCYTQLTDIEQEVNGLYYYDRQPKFDPNVIHAITSRKAAIEE